MAATIDTVLDVRYCVSFYGAIQNIRRKKTINDAKDTKAEVILGPFSIISITRIYNFRQFMSLPLF